VVAATVTPMTDHGARETTEQHADPAVAMPRARPTVVDCDTCCVRGLACHDCVVTSLLGPPPELTIDAEEERALGVLAAGGLVPPLRLVTSVAGVPLDPA